MASCFEADVPPRKVQIKTTFLGSRLQNMMFVVTPFHLRDSALLGLFEYIKNIHKYDVEMTIYLNVSPFFTTELDKCTDFQTIDMRHKYVV